MNRKILNTENRKNGRNFENFKGNPLKVLTNARSTIFNMVKGDLTPYFFIWGPNFQ